MAISIIVWVTAIVVGALLLYKGGVIAAECLIQLAHLSESGFDWVE